MIHDAAFRSTATVRILPHSPVQGMEPFAIVDTDGNGAFTRDVDQTVFLQSQDGGSALGFADLREAVRASGGTVDGKTLAQSLGGKHDSWVGFSGLPLGVTHPIVNYVFRLAGDGLEADYTTARSARVIAPEDGNLATLDFNGDGISDPAQDAAIQVEAYDDGTTWQSLTALDALTDAVRAAGGQVGPQDFQALVSLCPQPGRVSLAEFGTQLDAGRGQVERTLRLDEQGLVMDFHIR